MLPQTATCSTAMQPVGLPAPTLQHHHQLTPLHTRTRREGEEPNWSTDAEPAWSNTTKVASIHTPIRVCLPQSTPGHCTYVRCHSHPDKFMRASACSVNYALSIYTLCTTIQSYTIQCAFTVVKFMPATVSNGAATPDNTSSAGRG